MHKYIIPFDELSGTDHLQIRKGDNRGGQALSLQESLYVSDDAFYLFLELIFRKVVPHFDMFENTCITRKQWDDIMRLNISDFAEIRKERIAAAKTLGAIHCWVNEHIADGEVFTIIGV